MSSLGQVSSNTSIFLPKILYAVGMATLITAVVLLALKPALLGGAGSSGFIASRALGGLTMTAGVIAFIWGIRMTCARHRPYRPLPLFDEIVSEDKKKSQAFLDLHQKQISSAINAQDSAGQTILHRAAKKGLTSASLDLIESGADKEIQDRLGNTPSHVAALNGHLGVMTLCLPQINERNFEGKTPSEIVSHTVSLSVDEYLSNLEALNDPTRS